MEKEQTSSSKPLVRNFTKIRSMTKEKTEKVVLSGNKQLQAYSTKGTIDVRKATSFNAFDPRATLKRVRLLSRGGFEMVEKQSEVLTSRQSALNRISDEYGASVYSTKREGRLLINKKLKEKAERPTTNPFNEPAELYRKTLQKLFDCKNKKDAGVQVSFDMPPSTKKKGSRMIQGCNCKEIDTKQKSFKKKIFNTKKVPKVKPVIRTAKMAIPNQQIHITTPTIARDNNDYLRGTKQSICFSGNCSSESLHKILKELDLFRFK